MPHIGFGHAQDDATFTNFKWVNEGSLYDTINLNYRDNDQQSYYGLGDTQFTHFLFPQISQAVPRSSFSNVDDSQIYPFYYQESIFGSEIQSDLFNSATGNTLGMSSGRGRSSSGVKEGDPSIALAPISSQSYQPYLSKDLFDNKSNDIGLVISGILFPADRGVLALIRFPSDSDSISAGINTPAMNYNEVLNRVVGAIKLGRSGSKRRPSWWKHLQHL